MSVDGELAWRKARACSTGACVEVAKANDTYMMRDSKDPQGPVLQFTPAEWAAFVGGVTAGDFRFD